MATGCNAIQTFDSILIAQITNSTHKFSCCNNFVDMVFLQEKLKESATHFTLLSYVPEVTII